jgi:hypothetical protein
VKSRQDGLSDATGFLAYGLCSLLAILWITPGSSLRETAYALLSLVAGTTGCRSIHTEKQEATMTSFHLVVEEMKLQRIIGLCEQEIAPHWMHSLVLRDASGAPATGRRMTMACSDKEGAS